MTNRPDNFMPDEWGSFQFTTSADAKRAEHMFNQLSSDRDRLRERVKELTDMLMAIQELPDQAQASAAKHLADIALSKSPK